MQRGIRLLFCLSEVIKEFLLDETQIIILSLRNIAMEMFITSFNEKFYLKRGGIQDGLFHLKSDHI